MGDRIRTMAEIERRIAETEPPNVIKFKPWLSKKLYYDGEVLHKSSRRYILETPGPVYTHKTRDEAIEWAETTGEDYEWLIPTKGKKIETKIHTKILVAVNEEQKKYLDGLPKTANSYIRSKINEDIKNEKDKQ